MLWSTVAVCVAELREREAVDEVGEKVVTSWTSAQSSSGVLLVSLVCLPLL